VGLEPTIAIDATSELDRVARRVWPCFARAEARVRCRRYLTGLLARWNA
jgi:hypothetical protein